MVIVEVLLCPVSGEAVMPAKVWVSQLPHGEAVRYGQFQPHSHGGQECEWSDMVQIIVERQEKPGSFI
jgi:hypothetical protein